MGLLSLPASGCVSVDANVIIYAVQGHPVYEPLLRPLWQAWRDGLLTIAYSDILICEVLTGAFKNEDSALATAYETLLGGPGCEAIPASRAILVRAARVRAETGLRTPDAIHAASALQADCAVFLTNDPHFRRVPGLSVAVLDDALRA